MKIPSEGSLDDLRGKKLLLEMQIEAIEKMMAFPPLAVGQVWRSGRTGYLVVNLGTSMLVDPPAGASGLMFVNLRTGQLEPPLLNEYFRLMGPAMRAIEVIGEESWFAKLGRISSEYLRSSLLGSGSYG